MKLNYYKYLIDNNIDELNDLLDSYKENANKKEKAILIREKIELLKNVVEKISTDINDLESKYKYIDFFDNDVDKTFKVLLEKCNRNDTYDLRTFNVSYFSRITNSSGVSNIEKFYGKRIILSEKDIMDRVPNKDIFRDYEINQITDNMISNGYSVIYHDNYYSKYNYPDYKYNGGLVPKEHLIKVSQKENCNIVCFTYDDELGSSLNLFLNYLKINGGDIKDIPTNTLLEMLDNPKTLKKEIK